MLVVSANGFAQIMTEDWDYVIVSGIQLFTENFSTNAHAHGHGILRARYTEWSRRSL